MHHPLRPGKLSPIRCNGEKAIDARRLQYIQISSSSGQQGRFVSWFASAIRIAQRMGLHRLGDDPETMPPDDPALPHGKNSLKREMAVRLFHMLVFNDSLLSDSKQFRCYVSHFLGFSGGGRKLNLHNAAATPVAMFVADMLPVDCLSNVSVMQTIPVYRAT
jgi:hypothetical protein